MTGLKFIRQIHGMSLDDIGLALQVSKQTVSKWETHKIILTQERLNELGKHFNILDTELFNKEITNEDKIIILEGYINEIRGDA